jgi:hypothetical protein
MGWFYLLIGLSLVVGDVIAAFIGGKSFNSFGLLEWVIFGIGIIAIVYGIKELRGSKRV